MRVIITGGTGYIGRRLAASLATDGHEVIVLSRDPGQDNQGPQGIKAVKWDGRTAQGWGHLADGADAVVNLAGERIAGASPAYRWTAERKQRICDSRQNAGQAVMEAIRSASQKPAVLVQASGIDYYQTGDDVATEVSPPGGGFLSHVCRDCWEPATQEAETLGVRRAIIRTGPVIGPNSPVLGPMMLQHNLFAGGRIGSGQQWFSWVHLDDVVGAIRFLIENPTAAGAFNLCAPQPVTNAELSKTLGKVLGRPSWLPAPAAAFRLAFGEMAATLLEGVRAQPKRLLEAGYVFRFPQLEAALRNSVKQ